jgi:hypothetical protein
MRQAARALVVVLLAAPAVEACSTTCESSSATVRYTDGVTNGTATYYETGGPDEPFLDFPAGRRFELVHGLSRVPDLTLVYVSFESNPTSFSIAAGNEALIRLEPDVVFIKNDTCTDFYVRVEAWLADNMPSDAGSTDGG